MTPLGVEPKTFSYQTCFLTTALAFILSYFASAATLPYNLHITSQIDQSEERFQYMVLCSTRECLYATSMVITNYVLSFWMWYP